MNKLGKIAFSLSAAAVFTLTTIPLSACDPDETYVENKYSIVLNYNDSYSRARTLLVEKGEEVSTPAEPLREGYKIEGWYTQQEGGTRVEFPFVPDEDVTLYARWEAGVYDVTFDWNFEGSSPYVVQAPYNSTLLSSEEADGALPEREGFNFFRWQVREEENAKEVTFPYTVRRDVTFYARWIEDDVQIYNFTLDANYPVDTDKENDLTQTYSVVKDEAFPSDELPTVTCKGYVHRGWALSPDAKVEDVIDFSNGFVPTQGGTLYAIWTLQTYNVRFRYNSPDNLNGIISQNLDVPRGTIISKPETDPERELFDFAGWYTASQGGTKVEFPYEVAGSANLYAHWKAKAVVTDIFDAEFTEFNPSETFPGYSGSVMGCKAVVRESNAALNSSSQYYPLYNNAIKGNYYVSYMFKRGATLTFVINSTEAVTGATLIANLGAELRGDIVLSSDPNSPTAYTISVNAEPINYGELNISGNNVEESGIAKIPFRECTIGNINLKAGENVITLVTANGSASLMGGTMTAVAPTVDYIKIVNHGSAQLSWSPVYDNIYNMTR